MSHFTVTVVTESEPTEELITEALAPYHEFECTGWDDKYVQDIDITEDALADYEEYKGDYKNQLDFVNGWHGYSGDGKYSRVESDDKGNVTKVIRRTNPNSKWDWFVIGGRWKNYWTDSLGGTRDYVLKNNLDVQGMQDSAASKSLIEYDRVNEVAPDGWAHWDEFKNFSSIDQARAAYHCQPSIVAIKALEPRVWDADNYHGNREIHEAGIRAGAVPTFAILHKGSWVAKGTMGWFATVSEAEENWPEIYMKIFNSINDNHYLTCVDCHV